jgi:hypothetical protein
LCRGLILPQWRREHWRHSGEIPQYQKMKLLNYSGATLRRMADIKERIETLRGELDGISNNAPEFALAIQGENRLKGGRRIVPPSAKKPKRTMSAAARAKISAAQTRRWRLKRNAEKA